MSWNRRRRRRGMRGNRAFWLIFLGAILFLNFAPLIIGAALILAGVLLWLHFDSLNRKGVSDVETFFRNQGWIGPLNAIRDLFAQGSGQNIERSGPLPMSRPTDEAEARQREIAEIGYNADQALARAGNNLTDTPFLMDDIGLITYRDNHQAAIYRAEGVPSDATHIRPFIVLAHTSEQEAERVTVRFNLLDEQGNLRYTSRARYTLQRGQNFVKPNTWLPLKSEQLGAGKWSLQVSIDDQHAFAIHEFGWREAEAEIQFTSDGEIDPRTFDLMQQRLAQSDDDEPLSLDELLAQQKDSL